MSSEAVTVQEALKPVNKVDAVIASAKGLTANRRTRVGVVANLGAKVFVDPCL